MATILAIENVALQYDLFGSLASRSDVSIQTARSGWKFVISASQHPPDLMVLDHWMPDMLGDEVLSQLRRQRALRQVPVVMLAGGITPQARRRCEGLPPILVLTEKIDRQRIMSEISRQLNMCERRQSRISIHLPVQVAVNGSRVQGYTTNLSTLGASIVVPVDILQVPKLRLTFMGDPPDLDPIGTTEAQVLHVVSRSDNSIIGVEFIEPDQALAEFIGERVKGGQQLSQIISKVERLPSLPSITARVLEECLKEDAEISTIVKLIRSDPSMASYMLKTANAAAYRFSAPITTVDHAVALMGINAVRNALLGFTIFRHLSSNNRDKLATNLWRHSVACALACEILAPRFDIPTDEAFTLGLLHDCGKFLLLDRFIRSDDGWAGRQLLQKWSTGRERQFFGMSHAEIGAAVLSRWKVPERIHEVVALHHLDRLPENLDEHRRRAISLVRAADHLTYVEHLGIENGIDDGQESYASVVVPGEVEELGGMIFRELAKLGEVFGSPVDAADLCAEIVERANLKLSYELNAAEERNELLGRAYERTRQNLVSMVQSEKYHALGRISRGVAHEINNPLAYAISNMNTLEDYSATLASYCASLSGETGKSEITEIMNDLPSMLDEMRDGLLRVSQIVRSIQNFDMENQEECSCENIRTCVQEAISLVTPSMPAGISIKLNDGTVPDTLIDHAGMVRAFVEIMLNSVNSMPSGGQLDIFLLHEKGFVKAVFKDQGIGISEENIDRVFEPFFTTRAVGQGRGLGLSVAFGIISRLNGQILIGSTPGYGTVVEVRLPDLASGEACDRFGK